MHKPLIAVVPPLLLIAGAFVLGACTPSQETIMKQLGACKMQAIEKGVRDDRNYLTACMNTAGYRPKLDCLKAANPTQDYHLYPDCYGPITAGWFEKDEKAGTPSEGWSVREIHPCPDNDPYGLFTDADCDPVKPKRKPTLKMTKCTAEQFYADPQKCMAM